MPVAVLALAATLISAPTTAETVSDGAHPLLEEVVVTGSRIRRDALTARDWVLHVDGDDRDRSGLSSLGDMLARLPVSGSPLSTRFNSSGNFGFPADGGGVAAGASQVDLRHLLGLCSMPDFEDNTASRNRLASRTLHDVQAGYTFRAARGARAVVAGIDNVFDRDPPISMSASLNGYHTSVYDIPRGRFAYVRVAWSNDR